MNSSDITEPEGMTFPTEIDIKVFAKHQEGMRDIVKNVILDVLSPEHFHGIATKQSGKGNYQSLSCKVTALNKEEMDEVFARLANHPEILMVI